MTDARPADHFAGPRVVGRRLLLAGTLAAPVAACAGQAPTRPRPTSTPAAPEGTARFAALERRYDTRLGVFAVHTGTGATLAHRPDERFAFCSTFKAPAAAAVLAASEPLSTLDTLVRYTRAEVNSISPVTEKHIDIGMTLRQLCDAAVRFSDGTAGNLLMRRVGGPAGLTAYLRGIGDRDSRMDRYEPELNRDPPGDPRDTTTPRALTAIGRALLLGTALSPDRRAMLTGWMRGSTTPGSQALRAGLPGGWTLADKTGHGDYGRICDVAVAWPPRGAPVALAVLTERSGYDAEGTYAVLTDVAREITAALL